MKLFHYNSTFLSNVNFSKYFVFDITQSRPFFSCVVHLIHRPFANNDIGDGRSLRHIIGPYHSVTYSRLQTSLWAHCQSKEPLTALSFSMPHIPLHYPSVVSTESLLCKYAKAEKFLFKFANKTASSSISSWVKTC